MCRTQHVFTRLERQQRVDFRRYGSPIAWLTILVAIVSVLLGSLIGNGNPGVQNVVNVLNIIAAIGAGISILLAILASVTDDLWIWAVLPVAATVIGVVLTLAKQDSGPAVLAVALLSSLAVFIAEKADPIWQKRIIRLYGGAGLLALIVGGNGGTAATTPAAFAGIILALSGLGLALAATILKRRWGWVALLCILSITGIILPQFAHWLDPSLLFMPLSAVVLVYGLTSSEDATDRPVFGLLGLFSIILIVIGGTLVSSVLGLEVFADQSAAYRVGIDLYLTGGALGVVAWVLAMIRAVRTRAWGWAVVSLILLNIGACMFGIFGPSVQDFEQGKEAARLRKAAGI